MSATPAQLPHAALALPRIDWITPLELTLLGAIWGASFMFMRVAAPEFGAMPLASVRLAFGALALLPFLWFARRELTLARLPKLALVGAINSAIPFTLFAFAATRAPAGIGAISNSLTVLFTALIAFAVFGERIGMRRTLGLIAGFIGVVVLASGRTAGDNVPLATLAGSLAALLYAVSAHYIRRKLTDIPPLAIGASTLVFAALMAAPLGYVTWPDHPVSLKAWWAAAIIGVVCTGVAYAFYFRLLRRVGPARAVTVTYLVPLFAVGWAWLVLGEPLTLAMAIAAALILGGVAMSQIAASKPATTAPITSRRDNAPS